MAFNSHSYLFLFLPVSVIVYFMLNRFRDEFPGKLFLIAANLSFYAWGDIAHLPVLIMSVAFNFAIAKFLSPSENPDERRKKKILFILGVAFNIGLLGFYKYTNFFISNLNVIFDVQFRTLKMTFPLAISFFTFVQIAYLVDRYRGAAEEDSLVKYMLFATFFPQIISGPIVRHKEMKDQYSGKEQRGINWENIYAGLILLSMGLFKKVFVADTLAAWVSAGFDQAGALGLVEAWLVSVSFTLQIYYDFSGYTDMAIGSALFLNIRLPQNFNTPYKALNIQDFWRRWHMTLSSWLRDYLYIPLGGNRSGKLNTYRNIMITFILCGFWHGAGWTFIFWGFLHGAALVVNRAWAGLNIKMPKMLAWLLTFLFLNASWVFFRAPDFQTASAILSDMINVSSLHSPESLKNMLNISRLIPNGHISQVLAWIIILTGFSCMMKNSNQWVENVKPSFGWAMIAILLLLLGMPDIQQASEFIYFRF